MRFLRAILLAILVTGCAGSHPRVTLKTELGDITAELYPDRAPVTVANFLRYVDEGRFKGASFYRTVRMNNQPQSPVKIEVIQGGLGDDDAKQGLPPIEHETTLTTGIRHADGALSMARNGPGTASSEFFICIGDQPELNFGGKRNPDGQGFAAFGRVIDGMAVVRAIQARPDSGQSLVERVGIVSVTRR